VFVTQNGDWPARAGNSEYRWFGCDGLVCINPDYYEANKDRYRAALIPNGVDQQRFTPGPASRSSFDLPEGVPLVLMVSAMIASKNVDIGIDAVSRVPGAHLVVAGDGPLRDALQAKAAALMPGRFHRLTVTPDRMPDLYRSANIFLHLSRDESFGNVYVEAMASGVITVAWDLPRTRWITGDTAELVANGDVPALSARIGRVLGEQADTARLTERAARFAWRRIAGEYADFLGQVVAERRKAGQE
jgi:glycosyltransferase involved in cell wall biosynthesis